MNIFRTPVPVWGGDAGGGGGNDAGDGSGADAGDKKIDDVGAGDQGDAGDKGGDDKGGDKGAGDKGGSFLDGADNLDDKGDKSKAPADFPEDWRDKMAQGDAELRKALDRYKSPADVAKANSAAQLKLRSGKTVSDEAMPDPEKEPEKAKEWRKARGVPDDPTGYTIPDTVKALVTDADKPRLTAFTEVMHQKGIPAAAVGPVMEWYFQEQAAASEAIAIADKADKSEVEEELRAEWGPEFKSNSTLAKRFAEETTPGIDWFNARLADGRQLGSIPAFVRAMADMGREKYGDVSFAGGEASQRSIARLEELDTMQREEPDKYFGNPKLREEYQKLVEADIKAKGKNERNHSAKQ